MENLFHLMYFLTSLPLPIPLEPLSLPLNFSTYVQVVVIINITSLPYPISDHKKKNKSVLVVILCVFSQAACSAPVRQLGRDSALQLQKSLDCLLSQHRLRVCVYCRGGKKMKLIMV